MPRPSFDPRPTTLTGAHVVLTPLDCSHAADLFAAGHDAATWGVHATADSGRAVGSTRFLDIQRAHRVTLKTDASNVRSQRAIERIGGVREGVLRRHRVCWDGSVRDSVYYGIVDDEWPQVKKRLEGLLSP
jgi:hypothetical protein